MKALTLHRPWGASMLWGWILDERVGFARPVACLGHQKLWTVPQDVEEEIAIMGAK